MKHQLIQIKYVVFDSSDELSPDDQELMRAAHRACEQAYAPYSEFFVGAAARLSDGSVVPGANQENAAYPMCLCAERVVLATVAAAHPGQQIEALAITVHNPRQLIRQPGAPCGACRQVISECEDKQGQTIRILLQGEQGPIYSFASGKHLLPLAFGGEML